MLEETNVSRSTAEKTNKNLKTKLGQKYHYINRFSLMAYFKIQAPRRLKKRRKKWTGRGGGIQGAGNSDYRINRTDPIRLYNGVVHWRRFWSWCALDMMKRLKYGAFHSRFYHRHRANVLFLSRRLRGRVTLGVRFHCPIQKNKKKQKTCVLSLIHI